MRYSIGPICLCKDVCWIEISTLGDPYRVYLCVECSGMKYERYWKI